MIKRVNVFNTPSVFSFQEAIIQNNSIPISNTYTANTVQLSKTDWLLLIVGTILLTLGAFLIHRLWGEYQKEKKEEAIAKAIREAEEKTKAKNASVQEAQKRVDNTPNYTHYINTLVLPHESQNNGYPPSDSNQEDLSRFFRK